MAINEIEHPFLTYANKTKGSYEFMEKAKQVMPGGVTANIKAFSPYPIVMKSGNGAYLTDIDGNDYIDYSLSYGALMLGHNHPSIKKAIQLQIEQSGTWLFGTPHQLEYDFARKIQSYYPSMELLRYTNSGTEATLLSLRLAAAYTGKYKVAKFEGHYHGGYDQMLLSVSPPVSKAGKGEEPKPVPDSSGIDPYHKENTIILPFNDLESCERILRKNAKELSAVMIEPVLGGYIPAEHEFIQGLREITEQLGIVLIFDEVKTGFRTSLGGAQEYYQIKPDLTALGKVIGGGFPIGVVGGKKEILDKSAPTATSDVFDSSQSSNSSAKEVLFHSGTYNGHPMILAAGLATINVLEAEIEQIFNNTEILKKRLEKLFNSKGIPMKAVGIGSIFSVVLSNKEKIKNYRDLQQTDIQSRKLIDQHLLNKGIYVKPLNRYSMSTAHGLVEIEKTVCAYEQVITKLY